MSGPSMPPLKDANNTAHPMAQFLPLTLAPRHEVSDAEAASCRALWTRDCMTLSGTYLRREERGTG